MDPNFIMFQNMTLYDCCLGAVLSQCLVEKHSVFKPRVRVGLYLPTPFPANQHSIYYCELTKSDRITSVQSHSAIITASESMNHCERMMKF